MVMLRLFKTSDPFQQLEARRLPTGRIVIGRDPLADWTLADPAKDLSRTHCAISIDDGVVHLCSLGVNGVSIGHDRRPAPQDQNVALATGETIYLGDYMILVDEQAADDESDPLTDQSASSAMLASARLREPGAPTDAALLEAFCTGARLEPASFAGEDPSAVLARLGEAYRQVVDDLSALMRDRAKLKSRLHMERTTIAAHDNNPLKWAPPHRVAVDLLREGEDGFLKGAEAFKASFEDLRRHGACMQAGARSAVQHVLGELDPDAIDANVKRQPLHFVTRSDAAWKHFRERHSQMSSDLESQESQIDQALRAGYEKHLEIMERGEGQ